RLRWRWRWKGSAGVGIDPTLLLGRGGNIDKGIDDDINAAFIRITSARFGTEILDNFTERDAIINDLLELDSVEFVLDQLASGAGIDEICPGEGIGIREPISFDGGIPSVLNLDQPFFSDDLALAGVLVEPNFGDERQIIRGRLILRIPPERFFQL